MRKVLLRSLLTICFPACVQSLSAQTSVISGSKPLNADKFEFFITGLSTASDSADVVNTFISRPGIISATADLSTHKITVYTREEMPENDLREVIRYLGRAVIRTEKELSKYY